MYASLAVPSDQSPLTDKGAISHYQVEIRDAVTEPLLYRDQVSSIHYATDAILNNVAAGTKISAVVGGDGRHGDAVNLLHTPYHLDLRMFSPGLGRICRGRQRWHGFVREEGMICVEMSEKDGPGLAIQEMFFPNVEKNVIYQHSGMEHVPRGGVLHMPPCTQDLDAHAGGDGFADTESLLAPAVLAVCTEVCRAAAYRAPFQSPA